MKPRHLDPETLDIVLKALKASKDPWALVIETIARTGMRSAECLLVDPKRDIDQSRSTLRVHAVKGSNDRNVPIPEDLTRAILTGWKFPSNAERSSFTRLLRRHWERLRIEILGVGFGHCSLHGLRASYAVSVYKRAGQDITLVQELLGHKDLSSTGAYLRLMQAEEKRADILKAIGGI